MAGADPVGLLELALEAAAAEVDLGREPGLAQFADKDEGQRAALGVVLGDGDEDVASRRRLLLVQGQQDPLDPGRPADRRAPACRRAARPGRRSVRRRRSPTGRRGGRRRRRRSSACSSRGREPGSGRLRRRRRRRRAAPAPRRSARRRRPRADRPASAPSAITARVPSSSESKARSGLASIRSRTSFESSPSCARRCAFSSSR